jgi:hypothetical protein
MCMVLVLYVDTHLVEAVLKLRGLVGWVDIHQNEARLGSCKLKVKNNIGNFCYFFIWGGWMGYALFVRTPMYWYGGPLPYSHCYCSAKSPLDPRGERPRISPETYLRQAR